MGLLQESIPEIEVPRSRSFRRHAAASHDLRTNFIAGIADAHAAMHYNLRGIRRRRRQQPRQAAVEDTTRRPSPTRMEQGYPPTGDNEVDGYAIGDGNSEENSRIGGDPPVDPFNLDPPVCLIDLHYGNAVNLIAQHDGVEVSHLSPEAKPAIHHFAYWLHAPESQVEPPPWLGAAAGDAGANAI